MSKVDDNKKQKESTLLETAFHLFTGKGFAKTTAGNVNFHIYIDTDGYGWDYIDPRLVLY